jgi:hypothetical protein
MQTTLQGLLLQLIEIVRNFEDFITCGSGWMQVYQVPTLKYPMPNLFDKNQGLLNDAVNII